MRDLNLLIAFLGMPVILLAQIQEIGTVTRSLNAKIDLAAAELMEVTGDIDLEIQFGELILTYELPDPGKEKFYEIDCRVLINGEALNLFPEQIRQGQADGPRNLHMILLSGLLDRFINLKGHLQIEVHAKLMGDFGKIYGIDCSAPKPEFGARQQTPYYIAAGVGIAGIALGQLYRSQRDDIYDNEYLNASSLGEAQPLYEKANARHHTYLILTYAGSAVLVIDTIVYFIRRAKHKKNVKLWESCPGNRLSLNPIIELPMRSNANGQVGMAFTLSF